MIPEVVSVTSSTERIPASVVAPNAAVPVVEKNDAPISIFPNPPVIDPALRVPTVAIEDCPVYVPKVAVPATVSPVPTNSFLATPNPPSV